MNYTKYDETCTSNGLQVLVRKRLQMQLVKLLPKNKVDVKTVEKLIKGVKSATETRNITFKNFVNNN